MTTDLSLRCFIQEITNNYIRMCVPDLLQTPTPSIFSARGVYLVEISLYDKFDGS